MQITASCTRINGRGPCKAVFDGMVSQEIERQNAAHRREMESMRILHWVADTGRKAERRRHLENLRTFTRWERLANRIMDGWGQVYGIGLSLLDRCEKWGLIVKEGEA